MRLLSKHPPALSPRNQRLQEASKLEQALDGDALHQFSKTASERTVSVSSTSASCTTMWSRFASAETDGWDRNVTAESNKSNISEVSTAISLEECSTHEFFVKQSCEIDTMASKGMDSMDVRIVDAFREMMAAGNFFVTIVDPRSPDLDLIAVSEQFEAITDWSTDEVLGHNCRFLNAGSPSSLGQEDLVGLRMACQTGESFTTVFTNRRKSGSLFLNALDMRG